MTLLVRSWAWVLPLLGLLVLAGLAGGLSLPLLSGVVLVGVVLAAVHHAETVALRVGEPFGTLILAVAVTVIEAGLIVSLMLANREAAAKLFISEATVKTHLLHVYAKLGVRDRAAAVAAAFERGLLGGD